MEYYIFLNVFIDLISTTVDVIIFFNIITINTYHNMLNLLIHYKFNSKSYESIEIILNINQV